jgi:peptide-methionine (R)-S-oxide reductase
MRDPALDPSVDPRSLSPEDWLRILEPSAFAILRKSGTERAFTGPWLDDPGEGHFHCAACAAPLYASGHKFHSGCGWPSFFQEINPGSITRHLDRSWLMDRVELRCARCDSHLGHVFDDAPRQPTGLRHCINGRCLVFVAAGADVGEAFRQHRARRGAA